MSASYKVISEAPASEPEAQQVAGSGRGVRWRAGAAALLAGVLVAGTTAAWLRTHASKRLRRYDPEDALLVKAALQQSFPSKCGKLEYQFEYTVAEGTWGTNYDHIPTAEMCCAMCQGEPRCHSFTWVQNAGLDGCPSQCWLKGGLPTAKVPKPGLVSGVPPPRKMLTTVPTGKGSSTTMYCFSLMVPTSDEPKLLELQYSKGASIFACDATDVYSNMVTTVGGLTTKVVDSDLKCQFGGDSQSALNAWIFIAVWDAVIKDQTYASYDWTIKVDPDCVFLPNRLIPILQSHVGAPYLNNCKFGMHGPIEVFGQSAIGTLKSDYALSNDGKAPKQCVEGQHFGQWGEDMFMDQCLRKVHDLLPPLEPRLMCESHCNCADYYWCESGPGIVSYHPFKLPAAYENCLANALGGPAAAPAPAGPVSAPAAPYPSAAPAGPVSAPAAPYPSAAAPPAAGAPAPAATYAGYPAAK